jgi:hypothetical protein
VRRILRYGGTALALASMAFLVREALHQADGLGSLRITSGAVLASILIVAVVIGGAALYAVAWRGLLTASGAHLPFSTAYVIMVRSAIAKYLPGNVFQFLARAALARACGIPLEAIVVSTAVETILILIGALAVASWGLPRVASLVPHLGATPVWIILAALLGALATAAAVSRWRRALGAWLAARASYFAPRRAGPVVATTILELAALGACLALLNATLWPGAPSVSWVDFASGFSAAWIAGFVVPGAPGGIGIREFVLYGLLGRQLGTTHAAQLFLLARLLTTAADLAAFGISYLVPQPRASPAPEP